MTNDNDTPELDSNRYPVHEAAEIYPRTSGERRKALTADIEANGLLHRVVLCMSKKHGRLAVLKGCTRHDICLETGIEPRFRNMMETPKPISCLPTYGATSATYNAT
jgi:hypothetical protein